MKKLILLLMSVFMLFGCQQTTGENELNQYYLSFSSINSSKISGTNYVFDFKTNKTIKSENIQLESQYTLLVYDYESDCILYTSNSSQTGCDNIYFYNPKDQSSKLLTTQLNAINYIIPREDDFIILANPVDKREICLYKMDKKTYELQEIVLPHDQYNDMSSWNVFYIPQTDEVVIEAYSESEDYALLDKWNNEDHTIDEDFSSPYYFYIYGDGDEAEYLIEYEMPQPLYMVSNGKDILFEIYHKDEVYRYNRETKEVSKEKVLKSLAGVFYMSNNGQYLYQISNDKKIVKVDYNNKETIALPYELDIYDAVNCILSKK